MRGVTETVNSYDRESDISTHTPHARRDRAVVKLYRSIDISTHTPHARRDRNVQHTKEMQEDFNSHASCEA